MCITVIVRHLQQSALHGYPLPQQLHHSRYAWLQVADNAEPMAKEFNEQQLQPAAEYIAKNFEREARRLAKEVGPLAVGLPKAMRRAVQLNKVCLLPFLPL